MSEPRTRPERVREEALRLHHGPPRALFERVVHQGLLLEEALARIAQLEAILKTTDDEHEWPPRRQHKP